MCLKNDSSETCSKNYSEKLQSGDKQVNRKCTMTQWYVQLCLHDDSTIIETDVRLYSESGAHAHVNIYLLAQRTN